MSLPDAQQCKRTAIETLAKMAALDPHDDATPDAAALLISCAQVWATLATVPDSPRPRW